MTTKQEIINYIGNEDSGLINACYNSETHSHEFEEWGVLIQMIKDLKPIVKPLVWVKRGYGWVTNEGYFTINSENKGRYDIFWNGEEMPSADTLKEAQAYCQSCHDIEILGMVKYE